MTTRIPSGTAPGAGAGAGAGASAFDAFAPQAVPSAWDDVFRNGTLDAKWSSWDPTGSLMTASVDSAGLAITALHNGLAGGSTCGLYQPVPATDEFEICAHVSLGMDEAALSNESICGIFVGEDLAANPTTANICGVGTFYDAGGPDGYAMFTQSSYTNNYLNVYKAQDWAHVAMFMCIQYKKSTNVYTVWLSQDGTAWTQRFRGGGPSTLGVATHMGFHVNPIDTNTVLRSRLFQVTRTGASGVLDLRPAPLGSY